MTVTNTVNAGRRNGQTLLLLAACGLLGLNLVATVSSPSSAFAQVRTSPQPDAVIEPPFNASDQRKRMIEQLTAMNDRLGRLEAQLAKGIKVTELPPLKLDLPSHLREPAPGGNTAGGTSAAPAGNRR